MAILVYGADAGKLLNNLATNATLTLPIGQSVESFITDARGWVVAHGMICRAGPERWWLLGQHPDPNRVAKHFNRYIIREQAQVDDQSGLVCLTIDLAGDFANETSVQALGSTGEVAEIFPFKAFGEQGSLGVIPAAQQYVPGDIDEASDWQNLRVAHFWPLMGRDIWEKCIPQEIDRTESAISFTKGCYLGQETIARLDARGQIQKKLSLLRCSVPVAEGAKLLINDQEVGHVTSTASSNGQSLAMAVIRRGNFDIDQRLTCDGHPVQVIAQPFGKGTVE
jgi:hypothetical protein